MTAADDTDASPVPPKKLSLKEVAARFEAGDADVLEDYRTHNLKESGEQLQQTLLQNMPQGKALIRELVKLAEDLQGRVAGRNSEDAAQIKAGLLDLQAQFKSYEQSAKQAAKELTENAVASEVAKQGVRAEQEQHLQARIEQLEGECAAKQGARAEQEQRLQARVEQLEGECAANQGARAEQEQHLQARIEQLEGECAMLRSQVAEHGSTVQQLQREHDTAVQSLQRNHDSTVQQLERDHDSTVQQLQSELETHRASPTDQKENCSPMRDSSNSGSAEHGSLGSGRGSPVKRFPMLATLGEEAVSPAVVQSLSVVGSPCVGQTLAVVGPDQMARDNLPLQWLREGPAEGQLAIISGAVRNQYSPEVADVGCIICCRVGPPRDGASDAGGGESVLRLATPVTADASLAEETAQLEAAGGHSFFVVPVQHNGVVQRKRTVASLRVDADGLSVSLGGTEVAAAYHAGMQVCGARGGGDGAAQGMFLALNSKHVFMLALETPHKRNTCIGLIRALAARAGLVLEGPQEGP